MFLPPAGEYSRKINRLAEDLMIQHPVSAASSGWFKFKEVLTAVGKGNINSPLLHEHVATDVENNLRIVEKIGDFIRTEAHIEHGFKENERNFLEAMLKDGVRKNFAYWSYNYEYAVVNRKKVSKNLFSPNLVKTGKKFNLTPEETKEILLKIKSTSDSIYREAMISTRETSDHVVRRVVRRPVGFYGFWFNTALERLDVKGNSGTIFNRLFKKK